MSSGPLGPFGREMRHWRRLRGLSQLELAYRSGTTPRHVSFLETGRSRPSRDMVERLSEALLVPLRERNLLLEAAGFPAAYEQRAITSDDLAPFNAAMERMLEQHEPYPAFVIDRHWNIVRTNDPARLFLEGSDERNAVRRTFLGPWREVMQNWPSVAWNTIARLRDDLARYPDDEVLAELLASSLRTLEGVPRPAETGSDRVVCPHFLLGDQIIKTISMVARFGSPRDVTLDELRMEMIYPEDDQADRFFKDAAEASAIVAAASA